MFIGQIYGVYHHFQQYISYNYIVEVSFIGGGNRSTQRKPPTCYKSLTNFITYCHGVPRENHQPVTSH